MKRLFYLYLPLLSLNLAHAQEPAPAAPAAETAPAAPVAAALQSNNPELEADLQPTRTEAEAGDVKAARQMYMRYALEGMTEQAHAWAERYRQMLEKEAASGSNTAMLQLGVNYLTENEYTPYNVEQGVTWLTKALEAGNADAGILLGEHLQKLSNGLGAKEAYAKAFQLYSAKAPANEDGTALYWMGYLQQNGLGVEANPQEGIANLTKSAEKGNKWAYMQLFKTYTEGIGTEKDAAKSIAYAREIADLFQDGWMAYVAAAAYLEGNQVPQDIELGEKYLDMAAKANIPPAIYAKGRYLMDQGKTAEAYSCFNQAASMHQPDALIAAGKMRLYGADGVDKDESRGLALLEKAARLYNTPAAAWEIARYYESIGEQQLADEWIVEASSKGELRAMAARGLMHLNPASCVEWNPTVAYHWWKTGENHDDKTCITYLNYTHYLFFPLLLIIVFGLPVLIVHILNKKAAREEAAKKTPGEAEYKNSDSDF